MVVVGGGVVAARRLPLLVGAGARVTVISPRVEAELVALVEEGRVDWVSRGYRTGDLAEAWYALVATDDPAVNAEAAREAEDRRVFCVRADDAGDSTAWTPATAEVDGVTIGVLAGGDPRRAVRVRDRLVLALTQLARRAA